MRNRTGEDDPAEKALDYPRPASQAGAVRRTASVAEHTGRPGPAEVAIYRDIRPLDVVGPDVHRRPTSRRARRAVAPRRDRPVCRRARGKVGARAPLVPPTR